MTDVQRADPAWLIEASSALKKGAISQAHAIVSQTLAESPDNAQAWHFLATLQSLQKRFRQAVESYDRAIALSPQEHQVWHDRAQALHRDGQAEEALASVDMALKLHASPEALNSRGGILLALGRVDEAIDNIERSLALQPSHFRARYNLARLLTDRQQYRQALEHLDHAIQQAPERSDIHNSRAVLLRHLGQHQDAVAAFDRAIAISPRIPEFYIDRAGSLRQLHRLGEALQNYDQAIGLNPNCADYYRYRGTTQLELGNSAEALADSRKALALDSLAAENHLLCGTALEMLKHFQEAITGYENVLKLEPRHPLAFNGLAAAALYACDWKCVAEVAAQLPQRISDGYTIFTPFVLLGYGVTAGQQLEATERYLTKVLPGDMLPAAFAESRQRKKLRLAYLSADFFDHATAFLIVEMIERHDRERFEIVGISFGIDDGSEIRKRLIAAFDEFHEVGRMSDEEAANLIRGRAVDIAIDLKGHTRDARPGILARRPAPVQAHYLGYPATVGRCGLDFILADRIVLPLSEQEFYPETILHLPGPYQVNSRREISPKAISRRDAGLPPDAFVFCCFNNSWKITAELFQVWMRLLSAVPGSVLWLMADNEDARRNLVGAARDLGMDPSRLVFAGRLPQPEHMARQRLANLFLDTLPYNAHTTASDALFSGLPVVTCSGNSFAGRVAASLLFAMEIPELVTHSLQDYERVARELALNPDMLQAIAGKIASHRDRIFDSGRFARNMEAVCLEMWARRGAAAG